MEKYRQQVLGYWVRWQALSLKSKTTWLVCGLVCLGAAGLVWWAAQPDYRVLYAGLSVEEAGAITSKLRSKAIPFRLAAGGTTILVPTEHSLQVHLDLTAEGVAGSGKLGKGLEFFDQPMIGSTPFTQSVTFLRAQQVELAKTIMQIDPIAYARIHIVRPDPSPFVREQKPTTAGVMIKLRPGATLSRNTVDGIAALIAGSVEGLTKDNVKITDSTGRLLSKHQDGDMGGLGSFVDQKKDVEQYLAVEAERMLTSVLGSGRAIVVVRVDLDNKSVRERKETINAEGKVQKSEKTTLNKTNSTLASKGGAAGSTSNLGKANKPAAGGTISTQETSTAEYEYPRTVQEWQHKHGSIERITVAAFVDTEGANSAMSMPDIKEIIKKAVGFKADRDEIQVTQVHMPAPATEGIEEEWASHQRLQGILTIVRNVSIGMVALCILPIAWVLLRRRVPAPAAPEPVKLQRISEELDRNPEALAQILSVWIDRSETSNRKAA